MYARNYTPPVGHTSWADAIVGRGLAAEES